MIADRHRDGKALQTGLSSSFRGCTARRAAMIRVGRSAFECAEYAWRAPRAKEPGPSRSCTRSAVPFLASCPDSNQFADGARAAGLQAGAALRCRCWRILAMTGRVFDAGDDLQHPAAVPTLLGLDSKHALQALPSQKHFLRRVGPLFSYPEYIDMPLVTVLYESSDVLRHVYFPVDCVVSLLYVLADGSSAEIAVVGNDGRRAVKEGIFTYASDLQTADMFGIVTPSVRAPKIQCCGYRSLLIQMMVQRR